jgi:hypothetical protein
MSLDDAGKLLLENGMLLSALELWMEGLEGSRSAEMPSLKEYFSTLR